ncbi:hypothetical protein [Dermatobacter hominis]|uniref:hypothetical protein n=1 Tax=Dermatobacter hominis TaxID=2884263 RepID=UPI001D1301EA|nr:hypothetical protein [Dermatobacter hominis]UDY34056.1 hypothetical protein LH044_11940 [Dermatobacter hominis]
MTEMTTLHTQDAMWRSGVVRARLHLCSAVNAFGIANVYGTKPGAEAAIPATATTRRGAPPH